MTLKHTFTLVAVACAVLAGCASAPAPAPVLNDGQLVQPANYKTWPKYLSNIQRPDAKQVREIYMNDVALQGTREKGFPNGTLFVMENYAAVANGDGTLMKGPDGNLVKGNLVAVFVMGKDAGWGAGAMTELRNGNWIYSAYTPTGEKSTVDLNTCRACHLPLGQAKDFVHRYDQYFDQKKAAVGAQTVVAALGSDPHAALSASDLSLVRSLQR